MALSLITNRSQADVDRIKALKAKINKTGWASLTAQEQTEWAAGRGFYNIGDLNRVGAAVAYLADLLHSYGYGVTVQPVTTWAHDQDFTEADAEAYLVDLEAIKAAYYGATPLPPDMHNLTLAEANNIERLLLEVEDHLRRTAADFKSCGTFYAGQEGLI